MDQPRQSPGEPGPYLRLPWPLVAGVLLGVLGLALGAGLLGTRAVHDQVLLPTPTPIAVTAVPPPATPVPTPLARATSPAVAPLLSTAAVPSTPLVAPTAIPPPATPTALALAAPVAATATPEPLGTPSPSPQPTVDPALADEVSHAYEHYWQVRAEALFDLDPTHLPEVMAGDHLAAAQRLIDQLRAEGHAIQTDVEHRYTVVRASADTAQVADIYVDNSFYVDPDSHDPLTQPVNDKLRELYDMNKIDGTWRVVSLARSP